MAKEGGGETDGGCLGRRKGLMVIVSVRHGRFVPRSGDQQFWHPECQSREKNIFDLLRPLMQ